MVRLKNIKKNEFTIECDIIPEDSTHSGHMVVNADSGVIEGYTLPEGYEWCSNHVNHAKDKLINILSQKEIPSEKLVMWY